MQLHPSRRASAALFLSLMSAASLASAAPANEQKDIVFGQIASVTNISTNANAVALNLGYQIYFKNINDHGGIHGRQIKVINKDDGVVADRTVALTKELIDVDNAIAIGGYLGTAGILEVVKQDIPGSRGIAFIAPVSGLPPVVRGTNVFPMRPGYHQELDRLVQEAKETQRSRIAIVYQNPNFGTALAKVAEDSAQKHGVTVAATVGFDAVPDKLQSTLARAIAAIVKAKVSAVVLISGGTGAIDFIRQLRASPAADTQIYGLSVLDAPNLVKAIGADKAAGVVIAQAVPYPYSGTLPVVREYQALMKKYAPDQPESFMSLEGFLGAKIFVEGLKRAGPNPTRQKLIDALLGMNELDLGGISVRYSRKGRSGYPDIDLTIISGTGRLIH